MIRSLLISGANSKAKLASDVLKAHSVTLEEALKNNDHALIEIVQPLVNTCEKDKVKYENLVIMLRATTSDEEAIEVVKNLES